MREMFKMIDNGLDMKNLGYAESSRSRPFVSPLAWAYYSAYQAIVIHAVLKLKAIQTGIEKDFADIENITKLVKVALPHQTEYIDKYGPSVFHYLLDELESKLLAELSNLLGGEKNDKETVERAAEIVREAERLMSENSSIKTTE
jgi:hypothetical protein